MPVGGTDSATGQDGAAIDQAAAEGELHGEGSDENKVEADGNSELTLRALVTTKEAGVIIGKAGRNVAELREQTGVKAGVSKVVPGVQDRVLTVSGTLDGVAKAYSLIAQTMLENPITPQSMDGVAPAGSIATVRLLISHNLMGTIIGRQGMKIKHIQDVSGARMVANKEMLPQSTERVVDVQGMVDSIRVAVWEIGKCLIEDAERGAGTVHYNPAARLTAGVNPAAVTAGGMLFGDRAVFPRVPRTGHGADFARPLYETAHYDPERDPYLQVMRTQHISIPSDYVGCIIGKGGKRISEIRRLSGSRISIAKAASDDSNDRMFTITGTAESNEKALYLLYQQLEIEKSSRLRAGTLVNEEAQ
ncbi:hypothetical protein SYNPS1DRAFT_33283 [Syncephalis pseudoplumigaleata]|uniref:K Homology domain-containing protein n=1 Tax=Syncephalis pseudoplumigaleata TaxID=1712513 RepID=A0A4P9YW63_9FUNG|nr:hypothetical protein SYNPS1DRAFT_33283 [Syncephalis pseudoplumigaleata]|eukprot:RKP24075.1 hypothetical protein SYNPS1DRAFT_33283 [Syncephalis pseudoplumigaleata]